MTGQLAGAISGGLTLASVIVRMVHDMVRDAIADVIGKLTSKAAIMAVSLGTAAPWAVSSLAADVSSGLLGVFRTLLVWGFRLPWLGPGILARPRSGCGIPGLSEGVCDCISARSTRQYR